MAGTSGRWLPLEPQLPAEGAVPPAGCGEAARLGALGVSPLAALLV